MRKATSGIILATAMAVVGAEPSTHEAGETAAVNLYCIHEGAIADLVASAPDQYAQRLGRWQQIGVCARLMRGLPVTLTQAMGEIVDDGQSRGSVWLATTPWGHPVYVMVQEPSESSI